jgi:[ribosomal protein S5]-alanine N-acetyltransferase
MKVSLLQTSRAELEAISASRIPESLIGRAANGSLPPAFVAARALRLAAAGHPAPWSTMFLIVNDEDAQIVGACGFKTAPQDGKVEVGYGVSPAWRGRGAATVALMLLLDKAFLAGAGEVLAEVARTNNASTRVVEKAGFMQVGARVDEEDEYVIQWIKRDDRMDLLSSGQVPASW